MRHILVVGLLFTNGILASAQKNNFFADVGYNGHNICTSVTYNKKLIKHFGIGGGIQGCDYGRMDKNGKAIKKFVPGIFADVRTYVPIKKRSLLFFFGDLGMNFYNGEGSGKYEYPHSNGFYTGLGMGYFYRMTKRGVGPYITARIAGDTYSPKDVNPVTNETSRSISMDGTGVLSVGVKF